MEQDRSRSERDRTDRPRNPEDPAAVHPTEDEDQDRRQRDDAVDEASADSFPSSDPPSW